MEGRVPHAGADAKAVVLDGEPPQRLYSIDVDEVGWPR
jgi:hypothetical protein